MWTPVPPQLTGIADYSAELLKPLSDLADVEVFIDDGEPMRNVPKSIKAEGHNIVDAGPTDDGFRLVVERVDS